MANAPASSPQPQNDPRVSLWANSNGSYNLTIQEDGEDVAKGRLALTLDPQPLNELDADGEPSGTQFMVTLDFSPSGETAIVTVLRSGTVARLRYSKKTRNYWGYLGGTDMGEPMSPAEVAKQWAALRSPPAKPAAPASDEAAPKGRRF